MKTTRTENRSNAALIQNMAVRYMRDTTDATANEARALGILDEVRDMVQAWWEYDTRDHGLTADIHGM
jgi:hypothetical protein